MKIGDKVVLIKTKPEYNCKALAGEIYTVKKIMDYDPDIVELYEGFYVYKYDLQLASDNNPGKYSNLPKEFVIIDAYEHRNQINSLVDMRSDTITFKCRKARLYVKDNMLILAGTLESYSDEYIHMYTSQFLSLLNNDKKEEINSLMKETL